MESGSSTEIEGTTLLPTSGKFCSEYSLIAGAFRGRNTDTKWFYGLFVGKKLKGDLSSKLIYSSQQPIEILQKLCHILPALTSSQG